MFELSDYKKEVLCTEGHMLIMGGPGSGKTTIALYKANQIICSGILKNDQKVLFLSFARATISQVEQQAGGIIHKQQMKNLEISTYHAFAWEILKSHGYLINTKLLKLLPPHEAASLLSEVARNDIYNKADELFKSEGLVHFDLFASKCNLLLSNSISLRNILCDTYPFIILDEFQDTNADEWKLISTLGQNSVLISLADPEQRIYDFRGADPARITDFISKYNPTQFDFGIENNRSTGTDIVQFGNDLLSKTNKNKTYDNVQCFQYKTLYDVNSKHLILKSTLLQAYKRLIKKNIPNWSIAILVPSNTLMIEVSDYLLKEQHWNNGSILPPITHKVSIDSSGPSLAGVMIASLMEKGSLKQCTCENIIFYLCKHIRGKKGSGVTSKADLDISAALTQYLETNKMQGKNRLKLLRECLELSEKCNQMTFSGNVIADWVQIRSLLDSYTDVHIKNVAKDAIYLRLLRKGTMLYSSLNDIWKENGNYSGATSAVSNALTQEHFALATQTFGGINVMTIHKSKGKEFDEVIIYEGRFNGKIVSSTESIEQARLNLRVAVTRARLNTIILTPKDDPCKLIF